jgi:hypothetical protein
MSIEEIIYDVLEIKDAANVNADIDQLWLLNKINAYRAAFIREIYGVTGQVDPLWLQRYPLFDFEKVLSGDDPAIGVGSIHLGKFTLPHLVSLPDGLGLYQVLGGARAKMLSTDDFGTMMYRATVEERPPAGSGYVSRIGNVIYVWPYMMTGQANIIATNPMDVPVYDNGAVRPMRFSDSYPIDAGLAQNIVLSILTKDLQINEQSVSDIVNDSQSQLKLLKNQGGRRGEQ